MWLGLMWPGIIRHISRALKQSMGYLLFTVHLWVQSLGHRHLYKMPCISREVVLHGSIVYFHWGKNSFRREKVACFENEQENGNALIKLHSTASHWSKKDATEILIHWVHLICSSACNPLWTIFLSPTVNANHILPPSYKTEIHVDLSLLCEILNTQAL